MTATNIAFLRARPGCETALAPALQHLVELSRRNPDCFLSHLHRSEEDGRQWFLYENWSSHGALWGHLGTAAVQAIVDDIGPLLQSDLGLRSFRLLGAEPAALAELAA